MRPKHQIAESLVCFFLMGFGFSVLNAAEPKTISIGWTSGSNWTSLPFRVAAERGFWEKEGLKARFIQFQGTNLMLTALLNGELDYITIVPSIAGAAMRGIPVKIVAAVTRPVATQLSRSRK